MDRHLGLKLGIDVGHVQVAGMEVQMKNLKKYVKACDLKRKQVERKLLEAWEQDSKNQVIYYQ